jgi:G6PDH family F420-dependent oxidoreductase
MTLIGYTMMGEQAGPKQLVRDVALAEEAGFDFAVISDHYFPWLEVQGHAPYAWSVLGAAAQATDHLPLMTYVTCPTRRYHPAVVAQKAASGDPPPGSQPTLERSWPGVNRCLTSNGRVARSW